MMRRMLPRGGVRGRLAPRLMLLQGMEEVRARVEGGGAGREGGEGAGACAACEKGMYSKNGVL